jgi:hypothetical protein
MWPSFHFHISELYATLVGSFFTDVSGQPNGPIFKGHNYTPAVPSNSQWPHTSLQYNGNIFIAGLTLNILHCVHSVRLTVTAQ